MKYYTYEITEVIKSGSYESTYCVESPKFRNKRIAVYELRNACKMYKKSEYCMKCYALIRKWNENRDESCPIKFEF
jgi:hypothetical protein